MHKWLSTRYFTGRFRPFGLPAVALLACAVFLARNASATTITWNGAIDTYFVFGNHEHNGTDGVGSFWDAAAIAPGIGVVTNWTSANSPGSNDDIIFGDSSMFNSDQYSVLYLHGGRLVNSLTINSQGGNVTISNDGNANDILGLNSGTLNRTSQSSGIDYINASVLVSGSLNANINGGGALYVQSVIGTPGITSLNLSGSGQFIIGSVTGVAVPTTLTGTKLTLLNATLNGPIFVQSHGSYKLGNASVLNGDVLLTGGSTFGPGGNFDRSSGLEIGGQNITINGNVSASTLQAGINVLGAIRDSITFGGNRTISVASGGELDINSPITASGLTTLTGSGGLIKRNASLGTDSTDNNHFSQLLIKDTTFEITLFSGTYAGIGGLAQVGQGTGAPNAAVLRFMNGSTDPANNLVVLSDGLLDVKHASPDLVTTVSTHSLAVLGGHVTSDSNAAIKVDYLSIQPDAHTPQLNANFIINDAGGIDASQNATINGTVSSPGIISKLGTQTLTLAGSSNNSIAQLNINDSTVQVNKSSNAAGIGGTVNVGDGTGGFGTALLRYIGASNDSTTTAHIKFDGELDILANTTLGTITMDGGLISGNAATLTVTNSLTFNPSQGGIDTNLVLGAGAMMNVNAPIYLINSFQAVNGTVQIASGVAMQIDTPLAASSNGIGTLNGMGTLTLDGPGTFTIGSAATTHGFTGTLSVFGGKVNLNGSMTSFPTVRVNGGNLAVNGTLNGANVGVYGSGVISGTGTVNKIGDGISSGLASPGNSAGILTAGQVNPGGGLSFAFAFNGLTPDYNNAGSSVNDILHVTNSTPFTMNLAIANVVNLYFGSAIQAGNDVLGGFFTNTNNGVLSLAISNATFHYYFQDTNGTISFEGQNYREGSGNFLVTTVSAFSTTGSETLFHITLVPEPGTWALLGLGGIGILCATRRRNRIR